MSMYEFNFYNSNNPLRYLRDNEKPTLKRGKDYETLEELWSDYPETFNTYNINYFNDNATEILDIVNYKYYDSDKPYLFNFNDACDIHTKSIIIDDERLAVNIQDYLTDELYNKQIVKFMILYLELIDSLYIETTGGRSKHLSYDTELYLEFLFGAYTNVLIYLENNLS
jgi:hypothetical protein